MEKPCAILSVLRNAEGEIYTSEVARRVKCTYSHARKINLTKKGERMAEHLEKIKEMLI